MELAYLGCFIKFLAARMKNGSFSVVVVHSPTSFKWDIPRLSEPTSSLFRLFISAKALLWHSFILAKKVYRLKNWALLPSGRPQSVISFTKSTLLVETNLWFHSFPKAIAKFRIVFMRSTNGEFRCTIPVNLFARVLSLIRTGLLIATLPFRMTRRRWICYPMRSTLPATCSCLLSSGWWRLSISKIFAPLLRTWRSTV